MSTTTQVSQGIRNALGMWVATARALQPKAVTRTVRVTTNEGKNTMANAIRKRIALAAAVALGAGLLSAVPVQATTAAASSAEPFFVSAAEYVANSAGVEIASRNNTGTDATLNVSHPVGANNYVEITADTSTASAARVRVDVTGTTILSAGNAGSTAAVINTARTSASYETNAIAGAIVRFNATAVGSFTVKIVRVEISGGIGTETTLQTINVTVNAAAVAGVVSAAKSTSTIDSTTGASAADETIVASAAATANGGRVAGIRVSAKDANGVAVTGKTITATVSGPGTVAIETATTQPTSSTGRAVSKAMTNGGTAIDTATVYVFADGTSGVSTITIAVDGVTVATEKVTFYGKTSTLTATVAEPHIVTSSNATVASVVAKDANGVAVAGDAVTVASSNTAVATVTTPASATDATGKTNIAVQGVAVGTATITVTSAVDTTKSTTFQIVVTDGTIASLVLTSNKATYAAGEKITLTLTAKDKNGTLMGKKEFANLFTTGGVTASSAVVGSLFGETVTISAGVATVDVYAPLAAGTLTFSGKTGTAGLATAEQGIVKSLSVTISGSADIAQIKADLAALQKSTSDLIAALSAQVSYLRKQLNQLLRRR